MIEAVRRLPSILRMAVRARGPELPRVTVLVTGETFAAESKVSAVQVFLFEFLARRRKDMLCVVALRALQLAVLALQDEAGLRAVVKAVHCETRQRHAIPLMFDVAARTFSLTGIVGLDDARMQSRSRIDSAFDLTVAVDAFESASACAELVTRCALRHTFEVLMRLRQRPRRDLRQRQMGSAEDDPA